MATRIHLATGLAIDGDRVLLVASSYPSHPDALWNLPGGRQMHGELLDETVRRELREETGLDARVRELAYVSESYDGDLHFINATFCVDVQGEPHVPQGDDHVVEIAWTPIAHLANRLHVAVVREPLLAFLNGTLSSRYAGFHEAGISIIWPT